jgi:hypothetical protein
MMMNGNISPERLDHAAPDLFPRFARRQHDRLFAHLPPPGEGERGADQNPRKDAGEKELGDREIRRHTEDDEADRGRDHRTDDPACGDQPARLGLVVTGGDHHRHEQRRERGGVGDRRAR